MIVKKRIEIICISFSLLLVLVSNVWAEGEWATNGDNVYNTNFGNVGIGTTRPDRNLVIGDASVAYTGKLKLIGTRINTWEANNLYFGDDGNKQRYWMNTRGGLADGRSWAMFYDNREEYSRVPGGALLTPILITPDSDGSNSYAMYFHNSALNINSSGNIGLGTTNPKASLHIWNTNEYNTNQSPVGQDSIILRGGVAGSNGKYFGGITWFDGGDRRRAGIASVMEHDDSDHVGLAFLTRGTDGPGPMYESMRITRKGNVGIGTTRPDRNLVVGDASVAYTGKLKLIGTRTNTWEANNLYFGDDGNKQRYWMNTRGGLADGRSWAMFYDNREEYSRVPGGALLTPILITPDSDGSNSYAMYFHNSALNINSSGNIGLGTTNPKASLHIWNTNEYNTNQSPVGQDSIILRGGVAGSNGKYFGGITWFDGGDRRRAGIASVMEHDDSDHVGLAFLTRGTDGPGPMYESMRITRKGNVGIGTTNPQSKLAVNGTITAQEIKVESGWSDFVFDEDYDLASLDEVESFIHDNKHLPDIPSAKEVEQQGIAVSKMLAKQMQKIEEMTLYLIQLKKENDQLKERLAVLEGSIKAAVK